MLKVKLKDNLRYFDYDDSDFHIQVPETKELAEKHLRSYSIKLFLFTGRLEVVEGEALFNYKDSLVFVDNKGLYGKEYGNYYTKDLEFDTIHFLEVETVPKYVFNKLNGIKETKVEKKPEEKKPVTIESQTAGRWSKEVKETEVKKTEEVKKPDVERKVKK